MSPKLGHYQLGAVKQDYLDCLDYVHELQDLVRADLKEELTNALGSLGKDIERQRKAANSQVAEVSRSNETLSDQVARNTKQIGQSLGQIQSDLEQTRRRVDTELAGIVETMQEAQAIQRQAADALARRCDALESALSGVQDSLAHLRPTFDLAIQRKLDGAVTREELANCRQEMLAAIANRPRGLARLFRVFRSTAVAGG